MVEIQPWIVLEQLLDKAQNQLNVYTEEIKKNMPGSQREVENAIEEGVDFKWLTLPAEYIGSNLINKLKIIKYDF